MLVKLLQNIEVILASQSPRRKELLASMDVKFEVEVKSIDESIADDIAAVDAAEYIALKKLAAFDDVLYFDKLLITSDTVVVDPSSQVLGKPETTEEAISVLTSLSGAAHQVFTAVAVKYQGRKMSFTCRTDVLFSVLTEDEIFYYVQKYQPFDKAGSYGIQEWIGRVGVASITGSYENVMGLPTNRLYQELLEFLK